MHDTRNIRSIVIWRGWNLCVLAVENQIPVSNYWPPFVFPKYYWISLTSIIWTREKIKPCYHSRELKKKFKYWKILLHYKKSNGIFVMFISYVCLAEVRLYCLGLSVKSDLIMIKNVTPWMRGLIPLDLRTKPRLFRVALCAAITRKHSPQPPIQVPYTKHDF